MVVQRQVGAFRGPRGDNLGWVGFGFKQKTTHSVGLGWFGWVGLVGLVWFGWVGWVGLVGLALGLLSALKV